MFQLQQHIKIAVPVFRGRDFCFLIRIRLNFPLCKELQADLQGFIYLLLQFAVNMTDLLP